MTNDYLNSKTVPELVTYAGTEEQVKLAIEAGADHLILEDSKCSCRSYTDDFKESDYSKVERLSKTARKLNPNIVLSFNCDLLVHNRHFDRIKSLIKHLKLAKITRIRVQDIGVRVFIEKHYPEAICDLATETGNQNLESISFYTSYFKRQVLSVEMPYPELIKCKNLMNNHGNNNPEFEIQVQGPILIQYSNRRYMTGFKSEQGLKPLNPEDENIITKIANDEEFPSRLYPFYDNPHGHFMYLFYDRCLLNQLEKLKDLPLSGWLIDARGESSDYLTTALHLYKLGRDHYFVKENKHEKSKLMEEMKPVVQRPQRPGFFLANKTDQDLSKITKLIRKKELTNPLGTIVDYTKGKWVVVELSRPLNNTELYTILTPESTLIQCEPLQLRDLEDNDLNSTNSHILVKVKWQKGMQPKSKVFNLS